MKSSFGNIVIGKEGLLYGKPRKQYTRTKPIKNGWLKIKPLPREKASLIKLRRLGYSINQLSDAFGRSRSYIHKIIRTAIQRRIIHMVQMRKLPAKTRLISSSNRRKMLQKYLPLWMNFILGETDKPP